MAMIYCNMILSQITAFFRDMKLNLRP